MRKILKMFKFLHYLNIHNKDCRRPVYTEENTYLCLRTGNTYKKFEL